MACFSALSVIGQFVFYCITCRTRARSASAMPTKAAPPLPLVVGEPTRTPFTISKKKHGGRNYKKYAKGFLVGARSPFGGQATRLRVTLFAENGFKLCSKNSPECYKFQNCRPKGRFFFGLRCASPRKKPPVRATELQKYPFWSDFTRSLEPVLRKNADKCKRAQPCARYAPPRKHFEYFSISPV